jgi:hypothetical protein
VVVAQGRITAEELAILRMADTPEEVLALLRAAPPTAS